MSTKAEAMKMFLKHGIYSLDEMASKRKKKENPNCLLPSKSIPPGKRHMRHPKKA